MLGYKFTQEQDAIFAVNNCNIYYGYPKEGCVTESWINYIFAENDNFYYIEYDQSLDVILGVPEEIIITIRENI